ncbi:MAG TPA: DUF3291 domain-containing protein [Acetobacteraceae bacterium]|jgi:hypothetical protein|nr:DUF3291 domain-containing protein [Acetobacteraceae bacterium]
MRLAIYNFGVFRERAEHPANQGFRDRETPNFVAAERAPGFVARSGYAAEPGPPSWGEQVYPRFYVERGDGWSPATLSLWKDLESLMAFTYFGIHAEVLERAGEWFVEQRWPPYALWWVANDQFPSWKEAVGRFEHLHDHGPTPTAFNFQVAFDVQGLPTAIDRKSVAQLARCIA